MSMGRLLLCGIMIVMKKTYLIGIILIAAVAVMFSVRFIWGGPEDDWICQNGAWVKHGNPSSPEPTTPCNSQSKKEPYLYKDLIKIDFPVQNEKINSPVVVSGAARGQWYFEASFPVQILDEDGTILGSDPVQAQGEWMTTEFVPFSGEINFTKPKGKTGSIVFKKDNPSGLPQNDDSVSIPINF
jgi:hypothetical protein